MKNTKRQPSQGWLPLLTLVFLIVIAVIGWLWDRGACRDNERNDCPKIGAVK